MSRIVKGPEIAGDGRAVGAREDTIVTPLELLATLDAYDGSGESGRRIIEVLVALINQSPVSIYHWAERLDIAITDLIQTCHGERLVTREFREKVGIYFEQFRKKE